ncbi:hypothetical protein ACFBZI_08410 [Moraxella sp. ZJ142]|uniref:hypothetical protein n=1 Tax=Moraxella marmotae TaxID=3344520 RepID=UPI0035D488F5
MAVTDALSVAFKAVGIAADIYFGNYDGSKYSKPPVETAGYYINDAQKAELISLLDSLSPELRQQVLQEQSARSITMETIAQSHFTGWRDYLIGLGAGYAQ